MTSNETSASERRLKDFRIRLSVRLDQIINLLDGFKLLDTLRRSGYMILAPAQYRPLAHGAGLAFAGIIAQKGENILDGNTDRGVLGVEGPSFESVIQGFEEIRKLVKEGLGFDIGEVARFYEVIAQFDLETTKNPLEKIERSYGDSALMTTVNSIFEQETSLFSFRFVPKGKIPNQEEWFDITIEPDLIKPTTIYAIFVVYRSANRSNAERFGNTFVSNICHLIDEIEK